MAGLQQRFLSRQETLVARIDNSDMEAEEVRRLMSGWRLEETPRCSMVWLADNEGIELDTAAFVRHYDDLWLQGSDDVWVTGERLEWMVSIDHKPGPGA